MGLAILQALLLVAGIVAAIDERGDRAAEKRRQEAIAANAQYAGDVARWRAREAVPVISRVQRLRFSDLAVDGDANFARAPARCIVIDRVAAQVETLAGPEVPVPDTPQAQALATRTKQQVTQFQSTYLPDIQALQAFCAWDAQHFTLFKPLADLRAAYQATLVPNGGFIAQEFDAFGTITVTCATASGCAPQDPRQLPAYADAFEALSVARHRLRQHLGGLEEGCPLAELRPLCDAYRRFSPAVHAANLSLVRDARAGIGFTGLNPRLIEINEALDGLILAIDTALARETATLDPDVAPHFAVAEQALRTYERRLQGARLV